MKNVFYERVTFFDASINLLITYHRHAAQISLAFNTEIEMLVKDRNGPPKEKPINFFLVVSFRPEKCRIHMSAQSTCNPSALL